jgi:hypothetical protein
MQQGLADYSRAAVPFRGGGFGLPEAVRGKYISRRPAP